MSLWAVEGPGIDPLGVGPAALLSAVCSWRLVMLLLMLRYLVKIIRLVVICKLTFPSLRLKCLYLLYLCASPSLPAVQDFSAPGRHFEHPTSLQFRCYSGLVSFRSFFLLFSFLVWTPTTNCTKWSCNVGSDALWLCGTHRGQAVSHVGCPSCKPVLSFTAVMANLI